MATNQKLQPLRATTFEKLLDVAGNISFVCLAGTFVVGVGLLFINSGGRVDAQALTDYLAYNPSSA